MKERPIHPWPFRLVAWMLVPAQVLLFLPVNALAAQSTDKAPRTPEPPKVKVNRTVPKVEPPPEWPVFSEPATDAEIFRARVFDEPLVPMGAPTSPRENQDLASALSTYLRGRNPESVSALLGFLASHSRSAWRVALLTNLGVVYRRTGYYSKALSAWEEAWSLGSGETEPKAKAMTDRALGELAELNARLGRFDRLDQLFAEIARRDVGGTAAQQISGAKQGVWTMRNEPGKAFKCGPYAIGRVLGATRKPTDEERAKIGAAASTEQGTSLAQMKSFAESLGLPMQPAFRSQDADVMVPAMVHWKAGHFAAIVKKEGDRYQLQDPTFGDDIWVSKAALNDEASGYFLVPQVTLPEGWRSIDPSEAGKVWGKGFIYVSDANQTKTGSMKVKPNCNCQAMADWNVHALAVSLNIVDTPVGYSPPVGPPVRFEVTYNQRDIAQPQLPSYSNLGSRWTFDWLSYVIDDPAHVGGQYISLVLRGGGKETGGISTPDRDTYATTLLISASPLRYERTLPDGSREVFTQPDGAATYPRRVFMTQWIDPQGNAINFTYDASLRLVSVTDAIGQVTTLSYALPSDPLKITKVTDPFGRFASFEYNGAGQLSRITDLIGITSDFTYGSSDFIDTLTTPYGTTRFEMAEIGNTRRLLVTDPLGGQEMVEVGTTNDLPASDPTATLPVGMFTPNVSLNGGNTYYWDKRAAALGLGDYTKARITHWLYTVAGDAVAVYGEIESIKNPLENRVWYQAPGRTANSGPGTGKQPAFIGRVLDDGTTQLQQFQYNSLGKVTRATDPLGRATTFTYDTNGIDLLEVRQVNGQSTDLLASYTYNSQHLPLTHTDAGGQTTTFTYNAQGQIATVTTPPRAGITENRTTTYTYDSNGYLQSIAGPVAGSTRGYTYDGYGRVRTTTNADGYTVTYDYDALDRQTKATYPDGTYEETVYNRLDLEKRRDRLGRWSETFYDALRRPVATRDPLGRTTTQQWCTCGSLDKTIDSNGNATTWGRDLQGRMTSETRADSAQWNYVYENTTSRLRQVTDPKSETATFDYFLDNHAKQITYTNATTPTPTVSFTFDPIYDRIASVTDGTGTTTYAYYPVTSPPSIGALRLASLEGPLTNDTVVYTYDELGRLASRGVTGYVTSYSYDALGRRTTVATPVGSYSYAFDGVTSRPLTVTYPNGQSANYTYFGNSGNRLAQEIKHLAPGGAILSKNNYTYDAAFEIKTWTQQVGANAANVYELSYDNADQLTAATLKTTDPTPTVLKRYAYNYDKAGNRDAEQVDDSVLSGTYNSRNQLTSRQPGGALLFRGTVNEPATVTVGGKPATVDASNKFQGTATVPSGTSNVVVTATDPSGNLRTNTYQVGASGTTTSYTYDANGNLTAAGSRTFEWDARNQLAAVVLGTRRTEYTYDWASRRVRVLEKDGATVLSDRRYVWGDSLLLEERDGVSGSVLRRFYESVTDEAGTRYFETRDHQGNVRDVTDSSGGLVARYDYDPYGRLTQTSGTRPALFSYTGQWLEQGTSGAPQAGFYYYKARYYDPETARFLSEDPARSRSSPTLYAYVGNSPTNRVDPTGLQAVKCNCPDDKKPQVQSAFQQVCKLMLVNSGCAMALVKYGLTPCYARLCTTPPAITCTPDPYPCAWTPPIQPSGGLILLNTPAFSNKPCGAPNLTALIAHEMYHLCAGGCDVVGPGCTEAQANFTNARTSAIENACSGL